MIIRHDLRVSCDIYMESVHTGGVFIAVRVNKGGGVVRSTRGVFFWVYADGTYKVTNDLSKHLNNKSLVFFVCFFFPYCCKFD